MPPHNSRVAQYSDIVRFRSYCVDVTKCLPDGDNDPNTIRTEVNEVIGLEETPCDAGLCKVA